MQYSRTQYPLTGYLAHVVQAVWLLKCRAMTERDHIDDIEWDEEGIGEVLLDDNAVAQAPRPGTSLHKAGLGKGSAGLDAALRPTTSTGRPVTGFARPGTNARPTTGSVTVDGAFRGQRAGTSRVMTALGRAVRLGTASLLSEAGGPFIQADKLDLRKYVQRPALARALLDYLIHVDHNPRKALELAALATTAANFSDWWWKERLGKCYFQLGLFRDAEQQLRSSLKHVDMVAGYLQLGKVYLRLDQPATAQEVYQRGSDSLGGDPHLMLSQARVLEQLGKADAALALYRRVLQVDAANVEAIACLAANAFYADQPEVALRYYRRLLQMGIQSVELWCNLALCCFYAGQYDLCLSCAHRALGAAGDDAAGDVWYNVGMMGLGLGDLPLAQQALAAAIHADPQHAESHVNMGVLESRKGNSEAARVHYATAQRLAPWLYEAWYNSALLSFKGGNMEAAFAAVHKALEASPAHADSQELLRLIKEQLAMA